MNENHLMTAKMQSETHNERHVRLKYLFNNPNEDILSKPNLATTKLVLQEEFFDNILRKILISKS